MVIDQPSNSVLYSILKASSKFAKILQLSGQYYTLIEHDSDNTDYYT